MNTRLDPLDDDTLTADINMTPLIDVMLVLLVVFMVTLPVLHHAAKLALPQASSQREMPHAPRVNIVIDASGRMSWDARPLQESELRMRIASAAAQSPQPELQLYADRAVPYGRVAALLAAASRSGLTKIAFVTEPLPK